MAADQSAEPNTHSLSIKTGSVVNTFIVLFRHKYEKRSNTDGGSDTVSVTENQD